MVLFGIIAIYLIGVVTASSFISYMNRRNDDDMSPAWSYISWLFFVLVLFVLVSVIIEYPIEWVYDKVVTFFNLKEKGE